MLDASIAVVGLLMFGDKTREEITQNIFLTEGYPRVLSIAMAVCIAIIPITKLPLRYITLSLMNLSFRLTAPVLVLYSLP